jgi:hypothetical protein
VPDCSGRSALDSSSIATRGSFLTSIPPVISSSISTFVFSANASIKLVHFQASTRRVVYYSTENVAC